MQGELTVLLEILGAQRDFQAALVGLSEKKIKAITAGDAAALQGIVEDEKAVLARIRSVEKKQSQCVERLSQLLSVPVESVCMSLIIEKAEGRQRESLVLIRAELSELIEKQIKYNEINMRLLQMNMDYVQFLINTASNQHVGPTYGNGGSIQKTAGNIKRLLDRKV